MVVTVRVQFLVIVEVKVKVEVKVEVEVEVEVLRPQWVIAVQMQVEYEIKFEEILFKEVADFTAVTQLIQVTLANMVVVRIEIYSQFEGKGQGPRQKRNRESFVDIFLQPKRTGVS